MKNVIGNIKGHCPYCNSNDVDFSESEYTGHSVLDHYHCNSCKEDYREVFEFLYSESIGDRQVEDEE